ncbi:MAG TPA: phosphoribosylglycinamide formyltransferase [Thermoleophilaceae bacterium]|nr:phosphoribosylglycinamide formyltransferase [Thermoleophilaceae bacterium]
MAFRVAVLISGEGSNLQALLDRVHGRAGIEIACVASSRAEARGLERAAAASVDSAVFSRVDHPDREARDAALGDWLEEHDVDLVVLAGFMEILGAAFIRRFEDRLINVHPSLLPAFPGVRAIEQALDYGVKVSGVTVHFVDEGIDTGPVVLQEAFELPYARAVEDVERVTHEIEHRLLPRAVELIASGALSRDPSNPRIVRVREGT